MSQAEGATTSAMPRTTSGPNCLLHSKRSKRSAKTICISPTTETREGLPSANAFVIANCPTVAEEQREHARVLQDRIVNTAARREEEGEREDRRHAREVRDDGARIHAA